MDSPDETRNLDLFTRQCDRFLEELVDPRRPRRTKGIGKGTAVEILWAIGKYAFENNLELKREE